jgi:hypothetical protein
MYIRGFSGDKIDTTGSSDRLLKGKIKEPECTKYLIKLKAQEVRVRGIL